MLDSIQRRIHDGKYNSLREIEADLKIMTWSPQIARLQLQRDRMRETKELSGLLNSTVSLGSGLENLELAGLRKDEHAVLRGQLEWVRNKVNEALDILGIDKQ